VLHEDVLDLGGCDVLAAADNGVVRAPFDKEELRAVEVSAVLGREPAVLIERGLAGQVLAGDLVAAQPELARFSRPSADRISASTPGMTWPADASRALTASSSLCRAER